MSDRIVTHPSNDAYRNGYDAIFGNKHINPFPLNPPERQDRKNENNSRAVPISSAADIHRDRSAR